MKVLIADAFERSGIDGLTAAGCETLYQPELAGDALRDVLSASAADVLVVRGTKVTEAMLETARVSLIVRAGAGVNTIDVAAASRRGIYVSNCPGKNAVAVAELTMALILALDRRVADNVHELRAGRWDKKAFSKAKGLYGRTLGLLGYGSIAQEVARRAQAFGMPVLVWSRRFQQMSSASTGDHSACEVVSSPGELAERSDVFSVHLALTPETRGMVGRDLLARLRPGSIFVNTARGEVVDYAALAEIAATGDIRVGLDVFAQEPSPATAPFSDPIVALPNVYGTHHIGASTDQAQEAIAGEAVRIIRSYKETGKVPNVVNLAVLTPATHMLVVRHRDRPGVLAHVFEHLRGGNLNVQETENVIFDGAEAAVARINLDAVPSDDLLRAIAQGNDNVLNLQVVEI